MEPHALLALLVTAALDHGLGFVSVQREDRALSDVFLVGERWGRGRSAVTRVRLRVDGRHLHGPRAELYIGELSLMMAGCMLCEWELRAEAIARFLRVLPWGRPPPPASTRARTGACRDRGQLEVRLHGERVGEILDVTLGELLGTEAGAGEDFGEDAALLSLGLLEVPVLAYAVGPEPGQDLDGDTEIDINPGLRAFVASVPDYDVDGWLRLYLDGEAAPEAVGT
jgi:hypothetical protein